MSLTQGSPRIYTGSGNSYTAPVSVVDNSWNHLGWSVDTSGVWRLYVNGLEYNTYITESIPVVSRNQNTIGKYGGPENTLLTTANILVDDFRDFNRGIDLSYIQVFYSGNSFLSTNISPSNLTITDISTSSIRVSLSPNLAATTYRVRLAAEVLPATTISNVSSNQIVVSGISPSPLSNMYTVFVYGANSAGLLSYPVSVSNIPYKYANTISYAGSMRVFVNGYTGPVVRVRRSTDNAESDFYSDATQSYLTTEPGGTGTAYATWIGDTANPRVVIWYNQNGSSNHARFAVDFSSATLPGIILRNNKYVVRLFKSQTSRLQLDQPINPNTIFSQFWSGVANTAGGIACYANTLGRAVPYNMRFDNLSINGTSSSTGDWFFSGGAPKLSYVNGVSDLSLRTNSAWKSFAVSVTTPVLLPDTVGFKFIGGVHSGTTQSIDGFMTEIIFHNRVMSADNMIHFHNNRLVTDPT